MITPAAARRSGPLVASCALLLLALAWDVSGLDLPVSRMFGGTSGFPMRDAWLSSALLHGGGRVLAGALLATMLVDLVRPLAPGPTRAQRGYWFAVIAGVMLLLPAIKRLSLTSCPWDLLEFGGVAAHVPHWSFGVADGGPGHCFPSGHAASAFAFFGAYFLWRPYRPRFAMAIVWVVCALGAGYGVGQLARGAHFVSHTIWTAWIAWTACAIASAFLKWECGRGRCVRMPSPSR